MRRPYDLDSANLVPADREMERQVRRLSCPVCVAKAGQACGSGCRWAHAGRYRKAAARGLVKPFAGEGP